MQPVRIDVPQADLDDLRRRLRDTRWPRESVGAGWERGVPSDYLRGLAEYWADGHDWRATEAEINAHPQWRTEIDGVPVQFLHVRSPEADARPLLLTHGWPSSVVEFLDVIGPLSDPRAHGGRSEDAFHLVIPALPGHGFSGPHLPPGWGIGRVAAAWAELMDRLGYSRYVAAGGDWGSMISMELARTVPERVAGAHLSMLLTIPSGDPEELSGLGPQDGARLEGLTRFDRELSAYMKLQSTRPETIGYALTDSPVGQLAWITEKFHDWTGAVKEPEETVGRDRLLDTVSTYWFTGTATSSAALYYESAAELAGLFAPAPGPAPIDVPLGVAVWGQDPTPPVRSIAERRLPSITQWSEFAEGGHFAPLERPGTFVEDVRSFARSLVR